MKKQQRLGTEDHISLGIFHHYEEFQCQNRVLKVGTLVEVEITVVNCAVTAIVTADFGSIFIGEQASFVWIGAEKSKTPSEVFALILR